MVWVTFCRLSSHIIAVSPGGNRRTLRILCEASLSPMLFFSSAGVFFSLSPWPPLNIRAGFGCYMLLFLRGWVDMVQVSIAIRKSTGLIDTASFESVVPVIEPDDLASRPDHCPGNFSIFFSPFSFCSILFSFHLSQRSVGVDVCMNVVAVNVVLVELLYLISTLPGRLT